jgi:hypothetical protein
VEANSVTVYRFEYLVQKMLSFHIPYSWLIKWFLLEDELLSNFSHTRPLPNEGTGGDLLALKCLANFIAMVSVTGILMHT